MKTKIILSSICSIAVLPCSLFVASCNPKDQSTNHSISIDCPALIKVGEHHKFNAIFNNNSETASVNWYSSDSGILSIDNDGNVTAIKAGNVNITISLLSDPTIKSTKNISIVDAPKPTDIIISGSGFTYSGKWKQQYKAQVLPKDASQQIVWSVDTPGTHISDEGVLTVDNGVEGTVSVTATSSLNKHIVSTFIVDIKSAPKPINLTMQGSTELVVGNVYQYACIPFPLNANDECTWSLQYDYQNNFADVDAKTGLVTPKAPGSIDLVAQSINCLTRTVKHINILDATTPYDGLYIQGNNNIDNSLTQTYTAYSDESMQHHTDVVWSVTNNCTIVNQDSTSIQIKHKVNDSSPVFLTATLVKDTNISMVKKIEFVQAPTSIEINLPEDNVISSHKSFYFSTKQQPLTTNNDVVWSSSNSNILFVDEKSGNAQGLSPGTVTLTAQSIVNPKVIAQANITVRNDIITIKIEGDAKLPLDGKKYEYSAHITPETEQPELVWSVDNPNIATFDSGTSILKPRALGKVTITASLVEDPQIYDFLVVEICNIPKKISIIGDNVVTTDTTSTFKIVSSPEDSLDTAKWSIIQSDVEATINDAGELTTGSEEGHLTIMAQSKYSDLIKATIDVEVNKNIINMTYNSTVGKAFNIYGSSKAAVGREYTARFESTKYKPDDSEVEESIHKQLKPTDIEVIANGENIIADCSLNNNILTIPADKIVEQKDIRINILGAEIADWITWHDIKTMADDDLADDDPKHPETNTQKVKEYFQIGDYKRAYEKVEDDDPETKDPEVYKDAGLVRLVSFYSQRFLTQNEKQELIDEATPLQFEFEECYPEKNIFDNGEEEETSWNQKYTVDELWQSTINTEGEIVWKNDLKHDRLDKLQFFDISPRTVVLNNNWSSETIMQPQNDSAFYILSKIEYNITQEEERYELYHDGSITSQHINNTENQDFDFSHFDYYTNSYNTIKTIAERRAKPDLESVDPMNDEYDYQGYRVRDVYKHYEIIHPPGADPQYIDNNNPGIMFYDGTICYFLNCITADREFQPSSWKRAFCVAFSF